MSVDSYVHKGMPIQVIIRIKPEPYQRQDLKTFENKISLNDQYDMRNSLNNINILYSYIFPLLYIARDEFITNGAIFEQPDSFRANFEDSFGKYVSALVQGVNYTLFTFGSKGSGKTFALEGNHTETGLYLLFYDKLFMELESKRAGIFEELQAESNRNNNVMEANFSYKIRMKFVEIKDEGIVDLLQNFNHYKQPIQVVRQNMLLFFIKYYLLLLVIH